MNRNKEYQDLLAELEATPPQLNYTAEKALNRQKALQRKKRVFGIPAGSLAACFTVFVLLVNLFPTFAYACGGVPLLRELAKAVALRPSLAAAVDNEYVQPMGQSQTVNGITATIQYVIVDQKQLNIFFTLEGKDYDNLSAELPDFTPEQEAFIQGCGSRQPTGTMLDFVLDYGDNDVPDSLTITFGVTTHVESDTHMAIPLRDSVEQMLEPPEQDEPNILAEFTFTLHFDPYFTAQGECIPINQTVLLNGQAITITEAEVYPTHVRINVADAPENTAWLRGLEFYLENEDGERFEPVSNGVSASGSADSPMMASFRLESPYFAHSKHLTLHIIGEEWLDKDMERIKVDLAEQTAEKLPEDATLLSAEKRDGGWLVIFRADQKEGRHRTAWNSQYYDEAGNQYRMERYGMSTLGEDAHVEFELPLIGYDQDTVWLEPSYSRTTEELVPITIPIK